MTPFRAGAECTSFRPPYDVAEDGGRALACDSASGGQAQSAAVGRDALAVAHGLVIADE